MVAANFKDLLETSAYDFLKTDPHLGNNIILLTIGGSVAYGTNIATSDLDIRGVSIELKQDILGLSHFEQFEDRQTDTVIFGLKKFIKLCLNNNPNALELLGTQPEHILIASKEGNILRQHSHLFLSKKVIASFGNYAQSELAKLHTALSLHAQTIKKDPARTLKHAMHLARILISGTSILEGKGIQALSEKERNLLIAIRQGQYTFDQIFAIAKDLKTDFANATADTKLPDQPNYEHIQEIMMSMYHEKFCCR